MIKKYGLPTLSVIMLASCSANDHTQKAKLEGRKAAHKIIVSDDKNDMALEALILDAKIEQIKYIETGDTASAAAFDEAFRIYIKKHDKPLAEKLF